MIYAATINTLVGKTQSSPERSILKVTSGLVYRVEFSFPPGSAGLLGVAVFDGSYQVWPSTVGQWFCGDGIVIGFEDVYLKQSAPYEFTIVTYNDDTEYSHSLSVRTGMVSKDIFMARFLPHLSYKYFETMLDNLRKSQTEQADQQRREILEDPFPWLC